VDDLKTLHDTAEGLSLLYVEDNETLRANAAKLFRKIFDTVYVAGDGEEGLALFKEHRPSLVVTDIKMPKLNGLAMAKQIKYLSPQTHVILMSAFDDKNILHKAIDIGIYKFLSKPVNIAELTKVLSLAVKEIHEGEQRDLFQAHIGNIFNYQSSMIVMLHHQRPVVANNPFLDFYDVDDVGELSSEYPDIGTLFLEHEGFLYNTPQSNWLDILLANKSKIYNVKMEDLDGNERHFIVKCQNIPEKDDYYILSFDDVTDLHLLNLFDEKPAEEKNDDENSKQAIFDFLSVIQRNNAKIFLHNYYKGISITNEASIYEMNDEVLTLKMNNTQQKAIKYDKNTLLVSETLPRPILCEDIVLMKFDTQLTAFRSLRFLSTSPLKRETVRVVPEETHKVTLFLGSTKYMGEVFIEDISLKAVKLNLNVLPAGLDMESEVTLDMVFTMDKKPLIINTKATLFRKQELRSHFEIVCMLDLEPKQRSVMVKYITKRQMAIIREFKGLQYER
jgi:YesN/AraC family two-component response regulator